MSLTDRPKSSEPRRWRIALVLVVAAYLAAYAAARASHLLIHRQGHSGGLVATHYVELGDLAPSDPTDKVSAAAFSAVATIFAPLRYLEVAAWYLVKPRGSSLAALPVELGPTRAMLVPHAPLAPVDARSRAHGRALGHRLRALQ